MVHIRASHPFNPDGSIRFDDWFEALQGNGVPLDRDMVQRACDVSWQVHQASEAPAHPWFEKSSSYITGLDMAEILVELHLDSEAVVAAILYRSVRESRLDMEELERQFGAGVAKLVEGVLRMAAINETDTSRKRVLGQSDDQVENVRKMLLALIDDVRVALLKLAERTCAIYRELLQARHQGVGRAEARRRVQRLSAVPARSAP